MPLGDERAVPLMLAMRCTRSGKRCVAAMLCMPPMLDPMLAYSRSMPRSSSSRNCARTMSKMLRIGKRVAYGSPSTGHTLDGPVLPKHEPSTLVQITKKRFVSSALPGPIKSSHHPLAGLLGVLAACELADRPVCSKIALSRASFSVPHVSYAIWNPGSAPP